MHLGPWWGLGWAKLADTAGLVVLASQVTESLPWPLEIVMPATPHIEKHFMASESVHDVVIGMADGLTVPFALARWRQIFLVVDVSQNA